MHAVRCKKTCEPLAMKLDGGWCVCPSADECREHPQDNIAANVPEAYLRNIANRRDAVLVAKRFCKCGASLSEIEGIATAIEARAKALRHPLEA
jgi:hypothetical protein